jgi:cation diffusion facilitator family transporter
VESGWNSSIARKGRQTRGVRALLLSVVTNAALIVVKATAGILGNSTALLADAVHSGADLINSLLALASLLVSRRPPDVTHPYGHGRAEALAANFAGMIIGGVGLLVGWESVTAIAGGNREPPDALALGVAIGATALKLGLAVYARRVARATRSKAVNADARDHLADVVSGTVVIVGIAAARAGWPLLDPLAGLVVAGFILYTAGEVLVGAVNELMDTSLAPDLRAAVIAEAASVPGLRVSGVAGRTIGDVTLVEIHGDVDPTLSVAEAGRIIDAVKERLVDRVGDVSHVVVELNSGVSEPAALRVIGRPSDPLRPPR